MKKLYLMTCGKAIALFLTLFCGLAGNKAMGQAVNSVNITVSITPPYSPYYSDYAGINAGKVLLIVQNLSNTQRSIKLAGQLTGDNGIRLTTKSNYVPLQPIILGPNEVKKLSGPALKDIFDLNTLNVYGVDKARLLQTSRLPEGNYNFCVQALDYASNQMLSANAPLGCTNITIAYPEAPVLVYPGNNSSMPSTVPQSLIFNWMNAGFVPLGTQYVLQIAEMPAGVRVDPNQLLNSVSFPLVNKNINGLSYVLSPSDPPLHENARYAWRVRAFDPSGKVTFKNNGVSAANVFIYSKPLDAPLLISPAAAAKLPVVAAQSLFFNWKKSAAAGIRYSFQVAEIPVNSKNPNQNFNTGTFLINRTLVDTFYLKSAADPAFVMGKRYVWRVRAYDILGKAVFKNNGMSENGTFEFGELKDAEVLPLAPEITAPKQYAVFTRLENAPQPIVKIEWKTGNLAYPPVYEIKMVKVPPGIDPAVAIEGAGPVIFSRKQSSTQVYLDGNANVNGMKSQSSAVLEDSASYAIQVRAISKSPAGDTLRLANFGKSRVVQFTYYDQSKLAAQAPPPPVSSRIAGRFLYRFKDANEQPLVYALSLPPVSNQLVVDKAAGKNAMGGPTMKNVEMFDNDKFPDFIGNGRFPAKDNAKPLKNVKLSFKYVILQSSNKNPKSFTELKPISFITSDYISGAYLNYNGEKIKYNLKVAAATLATDGSFSISFINNYKLGYIGTEKGLSYFGFIRPMIEDDDRYFTSSDICLVPKPGKTTILPDELVFVRSYNADVAIVTDKTIKKQAVDPGKVLANYPVQLLDQHVYFGKQNDGDNKVNFDKDPEDNPLTMPAEANAESYTGQNMVNAEAANKENLPIVDIVKTDEFGVAHFKNLLATHTHIPFAAVNPFEGNFNYKPQYGPLIKTGMVNNSTDGTFNSDFQPETFRAEVTVRPKQPEIYLRAVTIQNNVPKGIQGAIVTVTTYASLNAYTPLESVNHYTDENGYLQLSGLKENLFRTIVIRRTGFADKIVTVKNGLPIRHDIVLGERYPAQVEQPMQAAGKIAGYIVNEAGQPVSCNIRVASGPFIKNTNGYFQIENVPTGWKTVEIVPTVDNYFSESLAPIIHANGDWTVVTNAAGQANGRIVLKEKLHRARFQIVDQNNNLIGGSETRIRNGITDYFAYNSSDIVAIASPASEFKVRVTAPGYVTYDDYLLIPLLKEPKVVTIRLVPAQKIIGVVVDAKTGSPIEEARVYTVSGVNADGELQNETTTDAQGRYTLYGAENLNAKFNLPPIFPQLPVKIYAVKSTGTPYIRQELNAVGIPNVPGLSIANFGLTSFKAKSEIWGIPVEINSVTSVHNVTKVSGVFKGMPLNTTFTGIGSAALPFNNVTVSFKKPDDAFGGLGGKVKPGAVALGTMVPEADRITLETNALKVTAFNQYACEVLASDNGAFSRKLFVEKNNGLGKLSGYVTSELASFNFSYDYSGKFLLNSVATPFEISKSFITVFSANTSFQPGSTYALSALYGRNNFNIHNFSAKFSSGYFNQSAFYLNADVNVQIPLVGESTLPAGQLKVAPKEIAWNQYVGDINLPLESWSIRGKGLMYDVNQGGFKVVGGSLKTNLPSVALNDLMIMPKSIDLGASKMTGNESLSLANVTPLNLFSGAKLTLNYDEAAPFDQKPHYRLNLANGQQPVAYIGNLPGMMGSRIDIDMLSTYSDGKHKTIMIKETDVSYYNVIGQHISGIEVADNFFTLVGNTDLQIPGANGSVTGRFKFYKDPTDPKRDNNNVVLGVEKLQTDVEMAGKVKFEGYSYELSPNKLTVDGNVLIYKNTPDDAIKGIRGTLTKVPGDIKMDLKPDQKIVMGSKSLLLTVGGNKVNNYQWDLLRFTGQPQNYTSYDTATNTTKDMLLPGGNLIDFVVNGALSTDGSSGKVIKLSDISSPFGNLGLTFDFDRKIFQGALTLSNANIVMGPVTVQDGTIDVQMDENGFVLVGAITNAQITAPLPSVLLGNFKSGIAIGYYGTALPAYMRNKLLGVTLYSQLPSSFNTGLKGFYVNVMKSLGKNDLPQLPGPNLKSIPIVGSFVPVFDFSAGIDLYVLLNVADGAETNIGGKAFAHASCLYDLEMCSIGLSGGADGQFDLHYTGGSLTGFLKFGVNANIIYCVGSTGVGLDLLLERTSDSFKFKPSLR